MRASRGCWVLLFGLWGLACGPHWQPPPGQPERPLGMQEGDDASEASGSDGSVATGPLVLQGTPEIPAELRARLAQYENTRSAWLNWLADDGKTLLVTTRFGQTSQAHIVRSPLGARTQLTFRGEPSRAASFVGSSTDEVVFVSDVGGNEQYQIYRADLRDGRTTLLTDGRHRHDTYVWSRDGQRIAYNGNGRNGRDMDIYVGDARSAAAGRLVLECQGRWRPIEFSRDGSKLLLGEYLSINDTRLYVLELGSRKLTRVTPEAPRASYRSAVFDSRGKRLYVSTDREGEFVQLYEVDLSQPKRAWRPLSKHIAWNVDQLTLSPDGKTLAFVANQDGYGVLYLLDTRTGKVRPAPKAPKGGLIRGVRFARNAPVLGFSTMGPTQTGDAYTYHVGTSRLTRWTRSEMGGLSGKRFVAPELVHYPSFDGRKIPAFVYTPRGAGPHPVLVWIHGGPESQARPYFSPLLQYLVVESGIAVVVPNVRGSDGYGKSFLLLDNGMKREDSVKDIGALLDWLKGRSELDAQRVGVFGGSYGGYMVLASLVHYADRLVAGLDYVGISNFVTFLRNTKEYRRDLRRAEYGDERKPEMHDFLQRISPSNNADKIKAALFVAHGANDPRVPQSETDQLVAAVQEHGQDVWYLLAKNEGHGFRKKSNRDVFFQLAVLFFEKHLGPRHRDAERP